ncbi:CDF family Co(II)/Ni(II) efflux transporter DmeF [Rubellimicrobium arenae]|uniref:CDF family Co(II)/Ni(II) efflux transporter DmeF n=1 Tax=Rubellimicrobium arenae TaxID=2817372 RepID=UPI001B30FB96|nr:CDF family Co(II)/Ni(II) efflux transporter DmeF [Rubellimicrobium arenae]
MPHDHAIHDHDHARDALTHEHVFLGRDHDANARRTLAVVGLTSLMMVGEIVAGYLTGSMALLADGVHMATHAGALGVAAAAYAFARRHARNPRFTFGTGKVGDLAGFSSALLLGVVAVAIAIESLARLLEPQAVAFGSAILVAVLGLAVNLISALLLGHGHHHGHHPHDHGHHRDHSHDHGPHHHEDEQAHGPLGRQGDNNLRAAYLHVLADALTSVLAIVALIAGRTLGWVWLDPAMGIVGAIVIARWSWSLVRDSALVLLDATDPALEEEVREQVEGAGDARITDLHLWRVGPDAHAAIVSVTGPVDVEAVHARLRPVHELAHVTVEVR